MLTKMPTKLLQGPMDQEHKESWRMRIYNNPLTPRVTLVFLVVHLTAPKTKLSYLKVQLPLKSKCLQCIKLVLNWRNLTPIQKLNV